MTKPDKKQKLNSLMGKLIQLGEDKDELWFWQEYFETMEDGEQEKLLDNLEQEVKDLKKLTK